MKSNAVKNAALSVLAICTLSFTACGEDRAAEMIKLIESGDIDGAYDYYDEEIDGDRNEDEICDDFADEMEDVYDTIADLCYDGTLDSRDIDDLLDLLDDMDVDEDDIEEFEAECLNALASKQNFDYAIEEYESENYSSAAMYFELVSEDDVNYEEAQEKLKECETLEATQKLEYIEDCIENGSFSLAITDIDYYLSLYSDNEEIVSRLEDLEVSLDEALIESAKTEIDKYFAAFDYYGAYCYIDDLSWNFSDNEEIQQIANNLDDDYVAYVVAEANALKESGDIDGAITLVEDAMRYIYGSAALTEIYNELCSNDTTALNTSCIDMFPHKVFMEMSVDDMINAFGQNYIFKEYDATETVYGEVRYEYIYYLDNYSYSTAFGVVEQDKTPTKLTFEFTKDGEFRLFACRIGIKQGKDGEDVSVLGETELAEKYNAIYDNVLLMSYGEGDSYSDFETAGIRSEYRWSKTACGDIWFIYGCDIWGSNSDYILISYSVPVE